MPVISGGISGSGVGGLGASTSCTSMAVGPGTCAAECSLAIGYCVCSLGNSVCIGNCDITCVKVGCYDFESLFTGICTCLGCIDNCLKQLDQCIQSMQENQEDQIE